MQDRADLADLLAQLEETKFLRLFRYLIDCTNIIGPGKSDDLNVPAVALDLPDAELFVKVAGKMRSLGSVELSSCFQIAHLPSCFWAGDFNKRFVEQRLREAFTNLAATSDPLAIIRGDRHIQRSEHFFKDYKSDHYYFFTNVCYGLDDASLNWYSETAHRAFSEILGVPRESHPVFGIGTPETTLRSGETASNVKAFLQDLLNTPSGYYILAREGKLLVQPMTEHGSFLVGKEHSNAQQSMRTAMTSRLDDSYDRNAALAEFEALLNDRRIQENELQLFLQRHPYFLFGIDERFCEIRAHVCLFDARRERLVPDFMARIDGTNIWHVIELKRPQHSLLRRKQGIEGASAAAARAIAELLRYRDYFSSRGNRKRTMKRLAFAPYEPCLTVVLGRGRSAERYEWLSTRLGIPSVQVVSYDFLFEHARACKAGLARSELR